MSFEGWKEYKLGDFAEVQNGYAFKSSDFAEVGVPVIKIKNIANSKVEFKDVQYYSQPLDKKLNQFIIRKDDILISMTGSHVNQIASAVGKVGKYQFDSPALLNQRVGKVYIKNADIAEHNYLYYFLNRFETQFELASCAGGSANQANISPSQIKNLKVQLPPINEQKKISSILSSLDDKIELNRQTNQTLEAIAQAIFKEWFVDFNFPGATGEMQDRELGEIPKGWKVGKLGDVLTVKGGTTPSTKIAEYWDGDFHWATPKDLSNLQSPVLLRTERKITEKGVKQISSGVLSKGTLLMSSRAPIGYLAITDIPVSINQGFIAINGTKLSNIYLLFWLKQNMEKVVARANGSTFLEISKTAFKQIEIVVPSKEVVESFNKVATPLFEQIKDNEEQTKTLTQLRDSLLPKLMKGEINLSK